ncbi:MAG: protein kinase domain-containing protein [Panacagrimonas sp.]
MAGSAGDNAEVGAAAASRRWTFAGAVFEERTLQLFVDGELKDLERKPLEVLRHLLDHAGDVVTKDELLESVWPGRVLTENVLTKCIGRLRNVLHDQDQSVIKTVHGYGFRFVAPVIVAVTERTEAPAHFDFKNGDHPPLRPLWSLIERLGTGGHGEAWLVRHDKTDEARVLKFAKDDAALSGLKREVTLFRLLTGSLGSRAEIVQVLDWNFEQAPFFVESEYVRDGSLTQWARARSGVHDLPLNERIELIARIAEAVSAMHSVGVLHKDLKPSNVLVLAQPVGPPKIKLGDFGSGGLLDRSRLEAMDITRMGFTKTLTTLGTTSGTPLYLAPELLAGQPSTVQADVYALGVMLYQIVVADFHRQLTTGWEREIEDEVLREDIAQAAAGDPLQRLSDAGELARRLRSLAARRAERDAERQARAKAEAEERARDRWKARRAAMIVALVVLAVGLVVSTWQFVEASKARKQAEAEAARAKTVGDFLNRDVLSVVSSGQRSVKYLTVRELLDSAAAQIGTRFDDQPRTAAEIHQSLGASYFALEDAHQAQIELEKALALYEWIDGAGSVASAQIVSQLIPLKLSENELPQAIGHFEKILEDARDRMGAGESAVASLGIELAWGWYSLGHLDESAARFRTLSDQVSAGTIADAVVAGRIEAGLGRVLSDLGDFNPARRRLLLGRDRLTKALGPEHGEVSWARLDLGRLAIETGDFELAETELQAGLKIAEAWNEPSFGRVVSARSYLGRLRLEQKRYDEAITILTSAIRDGAPRAGELDQLSSVRRSLALAYQRTGQFDRALPMMEQALQSCAAALGPRSVLTRLIRVSLADLLREMNRPDQAWRTLHEFGDFDFNDVARDHPNNAELLRVKGLLWAAADERDKARAALNEALRIARQTFGSTHARTQSLNEELARL